MDQNKENFARGSILSGATTQCHTESMIPKIWKLGEFSESRKFSAVGSQMDPDIEEAGMVLSRREIRRIRNQEIWIINKTLRQVVLQYP